MGASHLGLYLIKEGLNAAKHLDGACLFATPWDTLGTEKFFEENMYGLLSGVCSFNLNLGIRKSVLPRMKPYLSSEKYQKYYEILAADYSLSHINDNIF